MNKQYALGWNYRLDAEETGNYRIKSRDPEFIKGYRDCNNVIIAGLRQSHDSKTPFIYPKKINIDKF